MALIRCSACGVKPAGSGQYKRNYVRNVWPLGHQTALWFVVRHHVPELD
jgi:hypothetical protein